MKLERIRIKRVNASEDRAAWAAALADPAWLAGATVLKDEPGSSWVRRARMQVGGRERDVVVKCRSLNSSFRRIKAALREGQVSRQWRGAEMLRSVHVPAAKPIVALTAHDGISACEAIVVEFVPGPMLLELLAHPEPIGGAMVRIQHRVAAVAGRQIAEMTLGRQRYWNRDHKPSNLIVQDTSSIAPSICVVDCVGVREGSMRLSKAPWCRMFASLYIEPLGCGCQPRRALCYRVIQQFVIASMARPTKSAMRRAVRKLWRATRLRVERHGDPRPRVDPFAPPRITVGP